MNDELENAIKLLTHKSVTTIHGGDEVVKYSQAALNLARTLATLDNIKIPQYEELLEELWNMKRVDEVGIRIRKFRKKV